MREIGVHEGPLLRALNILLKSVTWCYVGMDVHAVFDERKERLRRTNCISTNEFNIEIRFFPYLRIRKTTRNNSGKDVWILLNLSDKCLHGFVVLLFNNVLGSHGILLFQCSLKPNFTLKK